MKLSHRTDKSIRQLDLVSRQTARNIERSILDYLFVQPFRLV